MAVENETDLENLGSSESQEVENEGEDLQTDTPAVDPVADRLKSFEAQLERQRQENDSLRESVRLQSRLLEQQGQGNKKNELSPELLELRKAIGPLLGEDIQSGLQPIIGTVSQLYDQNDAVSFQLQLQRENPDLLNEDSFNRISQVVDEVRQRAVRTTGAWVSRSDAYKYAIGDGKLKSGKAKKVETDKAEATRKKQQAAAQGTVSNSTEKGGTSGYTAEIAKIRQKATAGVRLSDDERAKWRDSMGNGTF